MFLKRDLDSKKGSCKVQKKALLRIAGDTFKQSVKETLPKPVDDHKTEGGAL